MEVNLDFVAVGVNRVVNALDWSEDGTVAFGAHHMAAIYDTKAAKIRANLLGHTGMVNCVHWIPRKVAGHMPQGVELLVSGSADATLRVWAVRAGGRAAVPWGQLAVLEGHEGPVTSVAVHRLPSSPTTATAPADGQQQQQGQEQQAPPEFIMVSTAGDSAMRVWSASPSPAQPDSSASYMQSAWRMEQALHVGTQVQHAVALAELPGSPGWLLLASGGSDCQIHLWIRPPGPGARFSPTIKLAGHENWVRSLAFVRTRDVASGQPELLLASASQDRYARVWRVAEEGGASAASDAANNAAGAGADAELLKAIMRYAPRPTVSAAGKSYSATLEALLIGHEDWVHSCSWQPRPASSGAASTSSGGQGTDEEVPRQELLLLTTSMDRSMVLWEYEASANLWMNVSSVGDAGASCLGYFGGVFSPDGRFIMAHGFTGALHLWERHAPEAAAGGRPVRHAAASWTPRHALGGHWDAVSDCQWGIDGGCVASVSEDQTARIFTAVAMPEGSDAASQEAQGQGHWCEIARPQIHGHDFSCLAFLPRGTREASYAYVCGSEEKVLRVLEAPQAFLDTVDLARGRPPGTGPSGAETGPRRARAFGAAVAALGLTNKAVDAGTLEEGTNNAGVGSGMPGGGYDDGPDFVPNAAPCAVAGPPLEEHLAQNTLWPESTKLYGHGDVIYCCAASPDGNYVASACVAKGAAAASIWVWDARPESGTWRGVAQLPGHALTVTQLAWSHCGRRLAAASRDRTFSVYERVEQPQGQGQGQGQQQEGVSFRQVCRVKGGHSRVVWAICWSHDDTLLATGSRDNSVKIWAAPPASPTPSSSGTHPTQQQPEAAAAAAGEGQAEQGAGMGAPLCVLPPLPCAATSVAFARVAVGDDEPGGDGQRRYLLAVGLESGALQLWRIVAQLQGSGAGSGVAAAECVWESSDLCRHAGPVNAIRWRPIDQQQPPRALLDAEGPRALQFASCSDDHSVRVFTVRM